MKYSLAIFDMDGTILDTLEDLKNSLNVSLAACGFPARTTKEVRSFIGNGIRRLVELGVPDNATEEQINRVFELFNEHYAVHCADNTKPYEGITDLINKLKGVGIKVAVVSNKADYAVQSLCEKYFNGMFDVAVGAKKDIRKKPYPDSVNRVLEVLDTPKANAVYIGDSEVDIETAVNAQVDCISVDWGFRDRDFLLNHSAKKIVSNTKLLLMEIIDQQMDSFTYDYFQRRQ